MSATHSGSPIRLEELVVRRDRSLIDQGLHCRTGRRRPPAPGITCPSPPAESSSPAATNSGRSRRLAERWRLRRSPRPRHPTRCPRTRSRPSSRAWARRSARSGRRSMRSSAGWPPSPAPTVCPTHVSASSRPRCSYARAGPGRDDRADDAALRHPEARSDRRRPRARRAGRARADRPGGGTRAAGGDPADGQPLRDRAEHPRVRDADGRDQPHPASGRARRRRRRGARARSSASCGGRDAGGGRSRC